MYVRPSTKSNLLFLTKSGSSYKDYTIKFKKFAEKYQLSTPPTATTARKLTSTEAHKHLNECDVKCLAKHMGHSVDTSLRYYEAVDAVQQTVHVHKTVEALIGK